VLAGAGKDGSTERFYLGDIEIIPVDFMGIMRATWSPFNLRLIRQVFFPIAVRNLRGYDVYHGHVYVSGLLAWYMARRNKAIAVNTVHGSYYPVWYMIEPPYKALFYRTAERFLAPLLGKLADLQIHTSSSFAKQVLRWGVPEEKIRYIPNGVDTKTFRERAGEASGRIIFTARRLVRKNGLEYLLKALAYLDGLDFHLFIAGDGPERERLEALARTLGLEEKVTFLGLLRHSEIPEYLAKASIAVIPSLVEATSLFMLEALAMGRVVIAARSEGLTEVISDENGMLVEPMDEEALAEAILSFVMNPGENRRAAAVNTAENFAWEHIAELTEREYLRLSKLRR
jgi:glycosyltransferase involved in cell wall biosynthesis